MALFFLYVALFMGLGFREARSGDAATFFVNGRRSGAWSVGISMVASCVGGSATIGMCGLAWEIGTPAFWWLGSGACGLTLLAVFLARKVRASGALTMPELVGVWLGASSRPLVAAVIVPAWSAILAAQFLAMGNLVAALTGMSTETALLAGALFIVSYTLLGGQAAVIRSDILQYAIMAGGLCAALAALLYSNPHPFADVRLELLNKNFTMDTFTYYMLILGGSYVVCPMLFGRLLSARDSCAAVRGSIIGIGGLLLTAAVIVAIGIAARGLVPPGTPPDAVFTVIMGSLPPWLGMLLLVTLLSAVLSSADSCLVTAATVCCNDLLGSISIQRCRLAALLIGCSGYAVARSGHGILDLLLMANDIYVCGVVIPVFVAMLLAGRRKIAPAWGASAILAGGVLGLTAACTGNHAWSYAGLGASAMLCLAGAYGGTPLPPGVGKKTGSGERHRIDMFSDNN